MDLFTVLLVQDETIARKDLKMILVKARRGFNVIAEAGDGEEALQKFHLFLSEIVIMDIKNGAHERNSVVHGALSLSKFIALYRTDYAAEILALSISTLPIIVLFAVFSKSLLRGLMAGSLKG
jgi:DNA-binding NarL/FixJ family response regulator